MGIMNSFVNDIFERIGGEASRLTHYNKRSTITSREIQTAVRLLLPAELDKHTVSEAQRPSPNTPAPKRPKPEVTVNPDHHVFRGETVTLTCDIQRETHTEWRYSWFKDGLVNPVSTERVYRITSDKSHSGKYRCRGERKQDSQRSDISDAVTLTVSEIPKPVLTVNPKTSQIFRGETVTLTCDVQMTKVTDWTYRWFCDGVHVQDSNEKEIKITATYSRYSCKCRCYAIRTSTQISTSWSDEVSFTVIEKPKPEVRVNPDHHVFRGETVTLTCDIQRETHTEWRYSWFKDGLVNPVSTERVYRITSDKSHSGKYRCRGERKQDSQRSDISDAVTLTVSDKPTPAVIVSPQSSVFTGDTVTLSCKFTHSTGWTIHWNKDSNSESSDAAGTKTIRSVKVSDGGQYRCRAQRGIYYTHYSNTVQVTVKERPKPVVTVNPDHHVFRGETVTLTCDIQRETHTEWRYSWFKDGTINRYKNILNQCTKQECEISSVELSHQGKYSCSGRETKGSRYTHISDELTLSVSDLPTAKLTVHPETSVFTGETVIMKCDIESDYSNWRYEWYKDRTVVSESERYTVNTNTLTIRGATESDQHQFCCRGKRDGRPATSQNTSVILSVKDSKLNPELTSDTAGAALTGNTVTLICHMTQTAGWDFYWYKHTQNSEKKKTETNSYRVHIDSVSDGGQYWCRAGRGEPVYYTNYSDALWVNVTAQRPSVSLIISPSRSQHFSSHSLSLNCEDHNNSTGWTVRRNTDSERMKDCSSTGSTCKISSLKTSDTGVYWCQSQSGENSQQINITVHDGDVILESSVHPVIEGDTLTLHCLHRSTNSSILTADFYKDGSLLQKQTTGEMSIPTVSKSHEGFYSCKHGERGQSPKSWISVTVSDGSSTRLVIWVVASVALLLIISLILMCRYKNNKDQQCINQQTSVQNQRTRPGESQTENCTLQSGCDHIYDNLDTNYKKSTGASTDEVTYSDVTIKNKISVDKDDNMPVANNVTYSEVRTKVKKFKSKDVETAGPADLTYAQINIHNTKKAKGKGKSSECGDTVYSDLKQNTDRGDSAGVHATYAQVFNHQKKKTRKNQHSLDVGQHTTLSDGHSTQELVQLLVILHCQLQVTGNDTSLLVVPSGVSSQLQDLSEIEYAEEEDYAFLGEVFTAAVTEWTETVTVNGAPVNFKLDTRAAVTAVPEAIFNENKLGELKTPSKVLYGPGRNILDVKRGFRSVLNAKGHSCTQEVYAVNKLTKPLLGLPAIESLNLVHRIEAVTKQDNDFITAYPSVFTGLGLLQEPYHIKLQKDATPYALSAPHRVPIPLRAKVKEELHRMEQMGVISKVSSPTERCAGMVVIPKPNGKICICVDLTNLNKWVKRERHILPAIDQSLAMLSDSKIFTKLDARSGFWQITLTLPEHFQRRMSQLLENYSGVICHADDILVFGRNKAEHDHRLHSVLKKIQSVGLTLNEKYLQLEKDVQVFVDAIVSSLPVTEGHLEQIKRAQKDDEICRQVKEHCLSGWPGKHDVRKELRPYWQGIPEEVILDNGPQFVSHTFQQFAKDCNFKHTTSSPHYPQANGEAERAVCTIKSLWAKEKDHHKALLTNRANLWSKGFVEDVYAPLYLKSQGSWSPGGRTCRSSEKKDEEGRKRKAVNYNYPHKSHPLPQLQREQKVWLATEQIYGSVCGLAHTPRSYLVQTERGMLRRNRKHLRPIRVLMSNSYSEHTPGSVVKADSETGGGSNSQEIPKPVLTVQPTSPIFRGENVTLTCDVQMTEVTDWTYRWRCDGADGPYKEREYTITVQNNKTCMCTRTSQQNSSHWSNEVTLTVIEIPKPVLTVNPKTSQIFRGENVTLTCDVQMTEMTDWKYRWRCDGADVQDSNEMKYVIKEISVQNNQKCKCRGTRTSRPFSSDWSDDVTLTVIERPKPVVRVNPDHHVFRGETVTLTCDIQRETHTEWRYSWIKDGHIYSSYTSTPDLKIRTDYESDSGKYRCRGEKISDSQKSDISDAVTLTVSEIPKPVLTVNPKTSQIFRGETVTLTCDVQMTEVTDWTYRLQCDGADVQDVYEKEFKITLMYSRKCWCYISRTSRPVGTSWSDEVSFTVIERPKPVVRVNPDHHVFRGETVTLTCDIQRETHTEWRYSWFKDGLDNPVSTERVYRITSDKSHSGKYRCRGERKQDSQRSDISDAVTLTVSDSKLNPELTSDTAGAALTGNTVTLICHMTQTAGWDFYWYKHTQNSEKKKTETNSYRVHIDSVSDGGQYWCRAGRGEPVYYTNYSDALWVNVTAQRPSVSLIISPSRSQHFSSHSLSLNCEDHNNSTGWTVRRYTDSERMKDCSSTGSTCKISSLKTSDTGVYWCQSQSGENSQQINITVHDGDVILESSVHPVIEGDTLTLHCLHRSTNSSILTADFYKDGSLLQNQTTGEMSIPTVSKSHEGFYSCKHGERGQSPKSWISVTVSDGSSTRLVIWVVAGLSVALLLIISVILMWRYKNNKDQQCINQQTSVQNQRTRPGESQTENCPLQSGCDHIYDDLDTMYKKSTGASTDEVTYSEVTIKTKISVDKGCDQIYDDVDTNYKKSTDVETAGPADLTYAQINIHNTKKAKGKDVGKSFADVLIEMKTKDNQRGKSSECGDTVYSDLKQNTDRGDSAGVDATYAQDFNHQKKKTRKN
ncbi:LOW QUALITY PROTEIN: uncharacterized protein LOC127440265 [Myxocyprinus asiaticus]|uniref:LOW QUALITY PROTEIN: uncharacterized protein LOC127440265 n=1 Tax=Myxocyprinus asiaticus TaxID=70543 RepID=UPI002223AC99|nr:LOW QUALITY PROTEIN: uncharacterized protein LOC127440265 [Myxocyprinus asiaticus]